MTAFFTHCRPSSRTPITTWRCIWKNNSVSLFYRRPPLCVHRQIRSPPNELQRKINKAFDRQGGPLRYGFQWIYNTDFNGFITHILMDFNVLYWFLGFQMIQWIFTNEVIIAFPLKKWLLRTKLIAKWLVLTLSRGRKIRSTFCLRGDSLTSRYPLFIASTRRMSNLRLSVDQET